MQHWTNMLSSTCAMRAEAGCIKTAFDRAFNALELCWGIEADARNKDGRIRFKE